MLAEMDENERKKYLERKERNKPDYYPEGKNNEGQWIARAPKVTHLIYMKYRG